MRNIKQRKRVVVPRKNVVRSIKLQPVNRGTTTRLRFGLVLRMIRFSDKQ